VALMPETIALSANREGTGLSLMKYAAIGTTRNRHAALKTTIESLLAQTIPPQRILFFDDGSDVPASFDHPTVSFMRRPDQGYDIKRVVKNWNLMLAQLRSEIAKLDYLLITADDCNYPPSYSETIMSRMSKGNVAVASGSRGVKFPFDNWKPPEGAGRFIAVDYLEDLNYVFPERAGYEPYIFLEAMRRGRKVQCYDDVHYEHLHEFGKAHGFQEWGHMAWTLGYDPIFFLGRCGKNLITGDVPRTAVMRMYAVYLKDHVRHPKDPFYSRFDPEFRSFVKRTQRNRIRRLLGV